jgi:hypothetical protein
MCNYLTCLQETILLHISAGQAVVWNIDMESEVRPLNHIQIDYTLHSKQLSHTRYKTCQNSSHNGIKKNGSIIRELFRLYSQTCPSELCLIRPLLHLCLGKKLS